MSARDPRIDPRIGDVLYKDGVTKSVWYVSLTTLNVKSTWAQKSPFGRKMNTHRDGRPTFAQWRRWAKDATVKEQAP